MALGFTTYHIMGVEITAQSLKKLIFMAVILGTFVVIGLVLALIFGLISQWIFVDAMLVFIALTLMDIYFINSLKL